MAFNVKQDYVAGAPISQVGVDWFNKVAAFLNSVRGGNLVNVRRPDFPSETEPVMIDVDEDAITALVTTAAEQVVSDALSNGNPAVDGENASPGVSTDISRADHVHPIAEDAIMSLAGGMIDAAIASLNFLGLSSGTPAAVSTTGFAGTGTSAARSDHVHALSSALLANTTPPADTTDGAVGTSTKLARADHVHPFPTEFVSEDTPEKDTFSGSVGFSPTLARSDHSHPFSELLAGTTPLGPTTDGAIGTGQKFARNDHQHPKTAADEISLATATPLADEVAGAVGTATKAAREDHKHPIYPPQTGTNTPLPASGTTANGTTWANTDNNGTGLVFQYVTRWGLINGSQYLFTRSVTFDKTGRLVYVSGETRTAVGNV